MMDFLAYTDDLNQLGQNVGNQGCWGTMAGSWMMGSGWGWLGGIFWFTTWILVILVLLALFRWLWLKGDKKRKK